MNERCIVKGCTNIADVRVVCEPGTPNERSYFFCSYHFQMNLPRDKTTEVSPVLDKAISDFIADKPKDIMK